MAVSAHHPDPVTPARVGLVVNPTAGHGRGRKAGLRTDQLLREGGHVVVELSGETVADALARARGASIDGLDALVVVGGDGMVHLGVNAVVGTTTPLGIVAAGSGNDFAKVLGLPVHKVDDAVARIVVALGHPPRAVDAVHVAPYIAGAHSPDGETWGGSWFAGALSVGLDAAVNARANTYTWPPGAGKYIRAVVTCVRDFKPYGYRITTDTAAFDLTGTVVAAANAPQIGGGVRIAPDALIDDGQLDVIYASALPRRGILKLFPGMYRGRHMTHPAVTALRTTSIIIEPTSAGAFPPVAFADGEVIGPVPLRAQVHPGALHLLV
ncbi:diacylglycerol kinase [Sanguibacter gelidistatuariae]|uniref:Diacylglycerol kinase n=1 Tax=Sanguibacter gelidistatuariae TaxID=1814289 RepID=A0A1G6JER4_9MICO|nr:diacylglycerol kinase family protein [Sanguibacter gelidistatuariae]SDC17143.1 diacylglycerol kinase [Sanguibacter gelidistatuariae]